MNLRPFLNVRLLLLFAFLLVAILSASDYGIIQIIVKYPCISCTGLG